MAGKKMTCLKAYLYSVDKKIVTESIWDEVEYIHWPVGFSLQNKRTPSSLHDIA